MNSMTGFGRGTASSIVGTLNTEIKSVNSRFLELNIRSNLYSAFLEDIASKTVKQKISRGKINLSLSFSPAAGGKKWNVDLDTNLLGAYLNTLNKCRHMEGVRAKKPSVSELLNLPEPFIRVSQESLDDQEMEKLVQVSVNEALRNLLEMRSREGEILKSDLKKRVAFLEEKRQFLISRQDEAAREYEERLKNRISKAIDDQNLMIDENRILQEVAIFSEKADYTEEVVRFGSHLTQFGQMLESNQPVGRKLDFLLQEINREVNTTASKASDTEVIDCVIIVKTELEKVREQVQNIE
ncbi:YicC/YloC family endoribonuclease [uncultured Dialister sp.]|uniref:YicC/YloC family endoribonuclease n=1 Tax=uncultured Dialister sp. TaxID=278064 RepID=UPI0025D168FE|nr:YicC/YloC family endoribonuclease [uncultured Dialister sp.]